jgi:hypothetical protein
MRYSGLYTFAVLLILPWRLGGRIGGFVGTLCFTAVGFSMYEMGSFFRGRGEESTRTGWSALYVFSPWTWFRGENRPPYTPIRGTREDVV